MGVLWLFCKSNLDCFDLITQFPAENMICKGTSDGGRGFAYATHANWDPEVRQDKE